MQFCDKLDFLMKISNITNKELAREINVDSSLISLLRNGKRKIPRNRDHIKNIALCLAKRCKADYQRLAVSRVTGIKLLRSDIPTSMFALQLENWLAGETNSAAQMTDRIKRPETTASDTEATALPAATEKTTFFYGDEGIKKATRLFLQTVGDGPIGIDDSSNVSRLTSDYIYSDDLMSEVKKLGQQGNTILHILPPITCLESYTESLKYLLPLYASGKVKVYYYPRTQVSPHFRTMIVSPGQCALTTLGISSSTDKRITIFTTDPELVNAYSELFHEYLAQCRPALFVHKKPSDVGSVVRGLLSMKGSVIQKVAPLSLFSMPAELAQMSIEQMPNSNWRKIFDYTVSCSDLFEERLKEYNFTDICRLETARQIRSGKVPIGCPNIPYEGYPCYTPETYIMHLRNILRLMDEYENYTFVPIGSETWPGYSLLVNEGGIALLSKDETTPLIIDFRRPEMVLAGQEHLIRIAEKNDSPLHDRKKIRFQLNALIRELSG